MTSMTPSNRPTEVLTVDVASIHQDPSWPIDPVLVTSFRASITRGEPPLLDLSLNRVRHADGTVELEIIDGMHRLEALRLEGIAEHSAKVREYSLHDAFYARIATSLGKPNDLFRQRAERALREGFIRDVAAHLEGATVYQRGLGEDGAILPVPRRDPLPTDPLLALGTILWIHFAAKPEVTEDWERYVVAWLDDIAGRLGKTPAWLRDEILDIRALLGEELPGKQTAERARLLLAIPDDGILRLVLGRLKAEPQLTTTDLRFALDILGCGPDLDRHPWLKSRGLPDMRSQLAQASLSQLARDYNEALSRAELASRVVKNPAPTPSSGTLLPSVPSMPPTGTGTNVVSTHSTGEPSVRPADSSQVFGIVSPNFAGTGGHQAKGTTLFPVSSSMPSEDPFMAARSLMVSLIHAWKTFDQQSGDWFRADVQHDLSSLRTVIDGYLMRGNSSAPTETTRKPPSRKGTV